MRMVLGEGGLWLRGETKELGYIKHIKRRIVKSINECFLSILYQLSFVRYDNFFININANRRYTIHASRKQRIVNCKKTNANPCLRCDV